MHGEVCPIQQYVITFVSDLRWVGGFLRVLPVSSTIKTYHHDITEILLKVALDIIPPFRCCQEGLIKQNDIIVLSF